MTRRYREDGERLVKIQNYYVRRPPQARPETDGSWRDTFEVLGGMLVLALIGAAFWLLIALAWASQAPVPQ